MGDVVNRNCAIGSLVVWILIIRAKRSVRASIDGSSRCRPDSPSDETRPRGMNWVEQLRRELSRGGAIDFLREGVSGNEVQAVGKALLHFHIQAVVVAGTVKQCLGN